MTLDSKVTKSDFEKSLLRSVEDGLRALGKSPREAIYYYLKTNFHLKREDIPEETEQFDRALNSIFGPGAEIIERYIIKDLYHRLKLNFDEKEDFVFIDYVRQAQLILDQGAKSDPTNDRKAPTGRRRQN
jgi:hypothetical protein